MTLRGNPSTAAGWVTAAGSELRLLRCLESLDVSATTLNADAVRCIARITTLRHLALRSCSVSAADARELAALTRLQSLDLQGNSTLGDAGVFALTPLTALRSLNLTQCGVEIHGLHALPALPQLQYLVWMSGRSLGEQEAQALSMLPALQHLRLACYLQLPIPETHLDVLAALGFRLECLHLECSFQLDGAAWRHHPDWQQHRPQPGPFWLSGSVAAPLVVHLTGDAALLGLRAAVVETAHSVRSTCQALANQEHTTPARPRELVRVCIVMGFVVGLSFWAQGERSLCRVRSEALAAVEYR